MWLTSLRRICQEMFLDSSGMSLWERLHESNLNRSICEQWWADVA